MADKKMTWDVKIPLITNPMIMLDTVKVFGIAFLIIALLFFIIFGMQGEMETLLPMLGMFGIIFGGLMILSMLIMVIVFGNKFHCRFTISPEGILFENVDKRSKFLNRAAIGTGFLAGSASTMGAGLTAQASEAIGIEWQNIARADFNPKRRTISIANTWRKVMIVYCSNNNWQEVSATVKEYLENTRRPEAQSAKRRSPLPKLFLLTIAVIIATLPLFDMPYPFEIDLFVPIFLLCFAAASIWLIRFLSVATLLGCGYTIYHIISIGLTRHERVISSGLTNTQFEMLDQGEWIGIIITFICIGFLITLSILQLQGKVRPALEGDLAGEN